MSAASIAIELPCYTIINLPQDVEQPSEMKLKEDLEKGDNKVFITLLPFTSSSKKSLIF